MGVRSFIGKIYYKFKYRNFGYVGKNVIFGKNLTADDKQHIFIGDNTAIGPNCVFLAGVADIKIGRYVMFGPNVCVVSGDHRTDIIGEYMRNVTNDMKGDGYDKEVVIEDDVWLGANVTVLKGVTIGRGSIVAAGALVRKNVPPYSVYINDQKIKSRFTDAEISEHEKLLKEKYGSIYPETV